MEFNNASILIQKDKLSAISSIVMNSLSEDVFNTIVESYTAMTLDGEIDPNKATAMITASVVNALYSLTDSIATEDVTEDVMVSCLTVAVRNVFNINKYKGERVGVM